MRIYKDRIIHTIWIRNSFAGDYTTNLDLDPSEALLQVRHLQLRIFHGQTSEIVWRENYFANFDLTIPQRIVITLEGIQRYEPLDHNNNQEFNRNFA